MLVSRQTQTDWSKFNFKLLKPRRNDDAADGNYGNGDDVTEHVRRAAGERWPLQTNPLNAVRLVNTEQPDHE